MKLNSAALSGNVREKLMFVLVEGVFSARLSGEFQKESQKESR